MRILILTFISCFVLLTSCKDNKTEAAETNKNTEQVKNNNITAEDVAKLKYVDYILDDRAMELVKNSNEYVKIETLVSDIKKGDLSFFVSSKENEKELFKNLRQTLPQEFNTDPILARILVLETKFYQLESLSNLSTTSKEELLKSIKAFLVSFSNLNLQMNKKVEFDNRTIEKP